MKSVKNQAKPVIKELLAREDDQLFTELGIRLNEMLRDPSISGSIEVEIEPSVEDLGAIDEIKNFGKRYFKKINIQAYQLVCGDDSENEEMRQKIMQDFGIGKEAVAASIAVILISYLGIAPAISIVVSSLIVKLFFQSAYETMCEMWQESIS